MKSAANPSHVRQTYASSTTTPCGLSDRSTLAKLAACRTDRVTHTHTHTHTHTSHDFLHRGGGRCIRPVTDSSSVCQTGPFSGNTPLPDQSTAMGGREQEAVTSTRRGLATWCATLPLGPAIASRDTRIGDVLQHPTTRISVSCSGSSKLCEHPCLHRTPQTKYRHHAYRGQQIMFQVPSLHRRKEKAETQRAVACREEPAALFRPAPRVS